MAAPIASQILGEVLPYLEINKDNQNEEDVKKEVAVPNVEGLTIEEAQKTLKEVNLGIDYETNGIGEEINKKETIIKEQLPKSGIKVYEGTNIFVSI